MSTEESKSLGVQLELNMEVKREADRKLAENDKEMEQIKRNGQRGIDSMQSILNSVVRKGNDACLDPDEGRGRVR